SAVERFNDFIDQVVLAEISQPVVIFVEEIDNLLSLSFDTDGFFLLIRSLSERRAEDPKYKRLTFAFLGVATPFDLIRRQHSSAFNIGHAVEMEGFQGQEATPLLQGLVGQVAAPPAVLKAVLQWTGGQPFLAQKLLKLVVQEGDRSLSPEAMVARLVQTRIIANWEAQDVPPHLKTIRDRLLRSDEKLRGQLLGLYQQILKADGSDVSAVDRGIPADESREQLQLRLTGLVVKHQGRLQVYNPIYAAVFDQPWTERALADLRPAFYGEAIKAWQEAEPEQKQSFLLRGQALRDAEAWAKGKSLSAEDDRFLDDSQEWERRESERQRQIEREEAERQLQIQQEEARRQLQIEQEEKRILDTARRDADKARNKANKRLAISTAIAALAIASAAIATPVAWRAVSERKTAQEETRKTKEEQQQIKQQQEKLNQNLIEAQKREKEARQSLTKAQKQEKAAKLNAQKAEQQAKQAQASLQQVNQEKAQAQEQMQQATAQAEAAENQANTARAKADQAERQVKQAQITLAAAAQDLNIAQQGTQVEQQGSLALRQFETDQSGALLMALEAGQRLQTLVKRQSKAKGAKLINQTLALSQYPAISPIGALLPILSSITERPIPTRQGWVWSVSWSSDGQTLASGGSDGSVKLWKRDGTPITTLAAQQGSVLSVSWSSDGQTLATGGDDGSVKLWPIDNLNLNTLLTRGCGWLDTYLINTPLTLQKLTICQTSNRTRVAAANLVIDSEQLAKSGDIDQAIQGFTTAKKWNPSLTFDPTAKANQIAQTTKAEAEKRAAEEKAAAQRRAAEEPAQKLAETIGEQAQKGEIDKALTTLQQLQQQFPSYKITGETWNSLCWFGSIDNQAAKVLFACDKAVALDPKSIGNRGLARALTGNFPGAISDFTTFMNATDDTKLKVQLQAWIRDLQAGKNPFTPEVLKSLRGQ
ncbi:MAG: AAA-like domain-containing protein, partial [Leptolyngbyaceae cyanobacterium]